MLNGEYLHLRLQRLRDAEETTQKFEGLRFVFCKGGQGQHKNGAHHQPLSPGDVLVLREGTPGKVGPVKGGDFIFWSFCLRAEHLYPLFETREIALLNDVIEDFGAFRHYPAVSSTAVDAHRLLGEITPTPTLNHRSQLVRIAAAIFNDEFKHAHDRGGFIRTDEHVVQVFESLTADEILNLSIGEMAKRFSCSRRHLNRLFQQFFGFSAASLKTEMRLLRAASLLRNPNSKVITVAEQCGFNHLGLFNTSFRRRFGVSPGQWRNAGGRVEVQTAAILKPSNECAMRSHGLCPWMGKISAVDEPCVEAIGKNGGAKKTKAQDPVCEEFEAEACFPAETTLPEAERMSA